MLKRFLVTVLLVVCVTTPVFAEVVEIGEDEYGITWFLTEEGPRGFIDELEVASYTSRCTCVNPGSLVNRYRKAGWTYYTTTNPDIKKVFDQGDYFLTLFYDPFEKGAVKGCLRINKEVEMSRHGYYGGFDDFGAIETNEKILFYLVNEERVLRGLQPLEWLGDAHRSARYYASSMAILDYFSHTSHLGEGPWKRFAFWSDEPVTSVTENIAGGMGAWEAHYALMASQSHRDAILNKELTHMGTGGWFEEDSEYQVYMVQHFLKY